MTVTHPIETSPPAVQAYDRIDFTTRTTTSHTAILANAAWGGEHLDLGSTRAAEPVPHLATASIATPRIVALDVLEHVIDEEAWIACFARLLEPGGSLTIRVPVEPPTSPVAITGLPRSLSARATFTPFPPATVRDSTARWRWPRRKLGTATVRSIAALRVTVRITSGVSKPTADRLCGSPPQVPPGEVRSRP